MCLCVVISSIDIVNGWLAIRIYICRHGWQVCFLLRSVYKYTYNVVVMLMEA